MGLWWRMWLWRMRFHSSDDWWLWRMWMRLWKHLHHLHTATTCVHHLHTASSCVHHLCDSSTRVHLARSQLPCAALVQHQLAEDVDVEDADAADGMQILCLDITWI